MGLNKSHTDDEEIRRMHARNNLIAMAEMRRKRPKKFKCDKCEQGFTTNQKLKFHKYGVHGEGPKLTCPYCSQILKTPANYQTHIRTVHKEKYEQEGYIGLPNA